MRRVLANRTYLGEAHYGDMLNATANAPLVDRATFEAAQSGAGARRKPKATFPMSGLARCESCGGPMVGSRGGSDNRRMYRCAAALATHHGERCDAPATVTADLLEELTRTALADSLAEHPRFANAEGVDVAAAEDALREAECVQGEYATDAHLQQVLGLPAWRAGAEERARRVEEARDAFREAARQAGRQPVVLAPDVVRDAELEDLGELLRGALAAVVVTRGRSALAGRVRFHEAVVSSPAFAWDEFQH